MACAVWGAGPALAQEFQAAPIAMDIESSDAGAAPVLVVALAPVDAPPVISGFGGGPRLASLTPEGLPRPSIIIGRIEPGQEAAFGIETLLPDSIAALAFGWRDLEAREAMRSEDPELFAQLVSGGHLDPPAEELVIALQTDLSRMNCYQSRSGAPGPVDKVWGDGSVQGVAAYFQEISQDPPGNTATPELYRAVMIGGEVACPTRIVRQQPVRTAPQQPETTANRPAAAQPPAADPPGPGPRIIDRDNLFGPGASR